MTQPGRSLVIILLKPSTAANEELQALKNLIKSEKENLQEVEKLVADLKSRSKSSEETVTCPTVTCPTQKPCPSQEACPTPKIEKSEEDLGSDLNF